MEKINNGVFPFYRFNNLSEEKGVLHFVSSGEEGEVANLSLTTENVLDNRERLARSAGFSLRQLTVGEQTHSSNVRVAGFLDAGRGGSDSALRIPDTDALVTNEAGLCLMVMTADCVPVLLYDPVKRVVGAVHAGWRGTVGGIAAKTVLKMEEVYGCEPGNIIAGIGPSIGKCCFEVGAEVADVFYEAGFGEFVLSGKQPDKYQLDLWAVNRRSLLSVGLKDANIETAAICTVCSHDQFFSYRFNKTVWRFGSGIMLEN